MPSLGKFLEKAHSHNIVQHRKNITRKRFTYRVASWIFMYREKN